MMNRYCFALQVRADLLPEYRALHQNVWPEMLSALSECGWHNYSLFARPDGLIVGYVESPDLAASQLAMAATAVNERWQASMRHYFVGLGDHTPDEAFELLDEIFNLDLQLMRAGSD